MRTLNLIRGRILVERIQHSITPGGIQLPGNRQITTMEGKVIAVGPGLRTVMTGEFITPQVKVGDVVLYAPDDPGKLTVDFDGKEYEMLSDENSVLAIIEGDKDE